MGLKRAVRTYLANRSVRRRFATLVLPTGEFALGVARSVPEYEAAFALVRAAYVMLGIEVPQAQRCRVQEQHLLPESFVVVARHSERFVGTISVTQDSPGGLPLDKDYAPALAALRDEGACLVELGAYAIIEGHRHGGLAQLLALAGFRRARSLSGTHVVIGVHPRTALYHRAVWGFRELAESKEHAELRAPVRGMVVSLDEMSRHLQRHFTKPPRAGSDGLWQAYAAPNVSWLEEPEFQSPELMTRWKLPRAVFQELFLQQQDSLANLDPKLRAYLETQRSRRTLEVRRHR